MRVLLCLLIFICSYASANESESQDEALKKRCLNSFEMIKKKDYSQFLSEIPVKNISKDEIEHSKAVLDRAYKRWFVERKLDTTTVTGIKYQSVSDFKKSKYNALSQARVMIKISGYKLMGSARCTFVETPDGWFLSKLP